MSPLGIEAWMVGESSDWGRVMVGMGLGVDVWGEVWGC